jgi:hypothetical protein
MMKKKRGVAVVYLLPAICGIALYVLDEGRTRLPTELLWDHDKSSSLLLTHSTLCGAARKCGPTRGLAIDRANLGPNTMTHLQIFLFEKYNDTTFL